MNSKLRLHFHSDCEFFGGSERLLPLLWSSERLWDSYSLSFSYRRSPRYDEEVKNFLHPKLDTFTIFGEMPQQRSAGAPTSALIAKDEKRFSKITEAWDLLLRYPRFLVDVFRLYRILRKVRPAVVHLNNGGFPGARSVRAGAVAARLAGCKRIVMTVNNIAYPYRSMGRIVDYPLDQLVKLCTNQFVTASSAGRQALISALRLKESRVRKISNAVGEPQIGRSRDAVRLSQDVDQEVTVIGIVGILEARKGHAIFLEALAALLVESPLLKSKIRVWFIGNGALESSLRDQVQSQGLKDTVQFLGYRLDHLDFVNAMDIAVLPSLRNEDSPLATIEAMALSKPVLATKVAGLMEQVVEGHTGYLIEPGNSADLSSRLKQLVVSRKIREEFGKAGRERYLEHFSAERFVFQYMSVYEDLPQ